MLLISHRGNVFGRNPERENSLHYIDEAINKCFLVEVDLWVDHLGFVYLQHDMPNSKDTPICPLALLERKDNLLVHAKNYDAANLCEELDLHWFTHWNEPSVKTSKEWKILHSNSKIEKNAIAMLPETRGLSKDFLKDCLGICSDIISFYA